MYIRNDYIQAVYLVSSKADIEALSINMIPSGVLRVFKCALEVMDYLDANSASDKFDCDTAVVAANLILNRVPELLKYSVFCDDTNNPPDVVARDQTILSIHALFEAGLGEYHYSFSLKEMS